MKCDRCDHDYYKHMPRKVMAKNKKTEREEMQWPSGEFTRCKAQGCPCDMYVEYRGTPISGSSFAVALDPGE